MDRFEAGLLRPRPERGEATTRKAPATAVAREARLWPAHRAGWLDLVGRNNPSIAIRFGWTRWDTGRAPHSRVLAEYVRRLRGLVEEDSAMRGLLAASSEARRLARWFLKVGDTGALPAILKEPRRPARPRRPSERPETSDRPAFRHRSRRIPRTCSGTSGRRGGCGFRRPG